MPEKDTPNPEEVDRRMARIDGALGAAGHEITDPEARANIRRAVAGEVTHDEARADVLRRAAERSAGRSDRLS